MRGKFHRTIDYEKFIIKRIPGLKSQEFNEIFGTDIR